MLRFLGRLAPDFGPGTMQATVKNVDVAEELIDER
jgi:hypothetical protein